MRQRQRRCILQPRVARFARPWDLRKNKPNPGRVLSFAGRINETPPRVVSLHLIPTRQNNRPKRGRQISGRVGVPPAGFGVSPKRSSEPRVPAGHRESSSPQDASHGGRDAHPTRDKPVAPASHYLWEVVSDPRVARASQPRAERRSTFGAQEPFAQGDWGNRIRGSPISYRWKIAGRSAAVTSRQVPAASSPVLNAPIFTRSSRSVGCPTAAVMRRT